MEALYLWPMLRDGVIKGIIITGYYSSQKLHLQNVEKLDNNKVKAHLVVHVKTGVPNRSQIQTGTR